MDILFLPRLAQSGYEKDVWELCIECDKEFVPPLSHRESTTQAVLDTAAKSLLPHSYFKELLSQETIATVKDGKVIAFMSFRRGTEGFENEIYVSTIIANRRYRGKGLTEKMYLYLFEKEKGKDIVTRTWSQNAAHLHVLTKLGFKLCKRLKDHRGAGIDTVYYLKENRL